MAQGYLSSSNEMQSLEDVGNQYVKILMMRSFFQDTSMDKFGHIESFKMHDLIHDLAMSVARSDCYLDTERKGIVGKPMHVAFDNGTNCSLDVFNVCKLRTIIVTWAIELITEKLKYLRALDVSFSPITELPKSIVEVITKLINLRELNIEECKAFEEMLPAGLGKLTSLQCLSNFVVGDYEKGTTGRLNELKELNNIRGRFCINNLGWVRDVASESHETNLRSKKYIEDLSLLWGAERYGSGECEIKNSDSLMLLDNLCPHQNVRELSVNGFPGVKFSDWVISLTNIVSIKLYSLPNCEHLPPLERLPCLKDLEIFDMKKLERIGDNKVGNENEIHVSVPPFPRLSSLTITRCPKLTYMPPFPHVQNLVLSSCRVKAILETCMVKHETSSFCPLSALERLQLDEVTEIEGMAEGWMKNLTSLQSLSLRQLSTVEVVLPQLQHLPSQLKQLEISFDSDKLHLWKEENHKCDTQLKVEKIDPKLLTSQTFTYTEIDSSKG
ncbi:hypothetical protein PIB30_025809 [Stylosanthes scabra]|uniref:Uncharacterized protein n=1 Tax=Stylosanthes scabra TaxID=79078 RepID=A0ABU6TAW8_9FABA|nr:hypothetical protein [Stylosanthes scabra]